MTTGERIRAARLNAGLTQKRLSELTGIAEPTIRKYESNRLNPKLETLQRIATALDVNLFALLDFETFDSSPDIRLEVYDNADRELKDRARRALLPSEFNEFEQFIETFGYYTRLEGNHYSIRHGDDSVEITPDELKKLVRSSRKTVAALIEAMMEEARGDNPRP